MHDPAPSVLLQVAAQSLVSADLAWVEACALQDRREWKLQVPAGRLPDVLQAFAGTHAVVPSGDTVLARYRTVYYDTEELRAFHDHRRGRPCRAKVRIRHYLDRSLTRFEVKARHARGVTRKHVHPGGAPTGRWLPEQVQWASQYAPWVHATLQASLEVRCRRITLVARQHQERITLDVGIAFRRGNRHRVCSDVGVIEVKSPSRRAARSTLERLKDLGLRSSSVSKYAWGLVWTEPGLRAHRLRPMLRRLRTGGQP